MKTDQNCKSQNETLIQKFNEKENEKAGAGCQTSPFAIDFLFVGKESKDLS